MRQGPPSCAIARDRPSGPSRPANGACDATRSYPIHRLGSAERNRPGSGSGRYMRHPTKRRGFRGPAHARRWGGSTARSESARVVAPTSVLAARRAAGPRSPDDWNERESTVCCPHSRSFFGRAIAIKTAAEYLEELAIGRAHDVPGASTIPSRETTLAARKMEPGGLDPVSARHARPDRATRGGGTFRSGHRSPSRDQRHDGRSLAVALPCSRRRWDPPRSTTSRVPSSGFPGTGASHPDQDPLRTTGRFPALVHAFARPRRRGESYHRTSDLEGPQRTSSPFPYFVDSSRPKVPLPVG